VVVHHHGANTGRAQVQAQEEMSVDGGTARCRNVRHGRIVGPRPGPPAQAGAVSGIDDGRAGIRGQGCGMADDGDDLDHCRRGSAGKGDGAAAPEQRGQHEGAASQYNGSHAECNGAAA
jgi:hypothetical protein